MEYIKNEYVVVSAQGVPRRTTKLKIAWNYVFFGQ
jgi:hypothetical protein